MKKYIISALAALLSATAANAGCLDTIKERGVLNAGTGVMGLKPYVWKDEKAGTYAGIEGELLAEVAKRIGVAKSEFVVTDWSALIPGLQSDRWDLILSSMFVTQERIQGANIHFSNPYFRLFNVVVVLKDGPIKTVEDLKGKKVASVLGTLDSANAHKLKDEGKVAEVLDFNGYGEPFQALRSGQVSAVVLDHASFQSQADDLGDVATVGNPMDYNPKADWKDAEAKAPYIFGTLAMGIRPECSDLEQAVNQALADMEKDGTRKAILSKYHMWNDGQAVLIK